MIALRTSKSGKKRPRIPDGVRVYAIGDIHGRVDLLDKLLTKIDADLATNPASIGIEVYLGDYIDRGPASREVVDRLVARNQTFRAVFLKGNHETFLTSFVTNPPVLKDWQLLGGVATLKSYGIAPPINATENVHAQLASKFDQVLPAAHRRFLNNLRSSFTCGDFFFVHAGIRPGIPIAKQREEDLLWISAGFSPMRR